MTEQPKYGILKREDYNTLFSLIPIRLSLVEMEITSFREDRIRSSMSGKQASLIASNKISPPTITQ